MRLSPNGDIAVLDRLTSILLALLVFSVGMCLEHHLIYVDGYVGAADGLTIKPEDLCAVFLLILHTQRFGVYQGLKLPPLIAWAVLVFLLTDTLSILAASDLALSLYGLYNHLRTVLLFLIVYWSLRHNPRQLKAFYTGVLLTAGMSGIVCLLEFATQENFRQNQLVDYMAGFEGFRASGFSTPTTAAGYIAFLLPLVLIQVIASQSTIRRQAAIFCTLAGVVGVICTLTRGALACLPLGLAPVLVAGYRCRLIKTAYVIPTVLVIAVAAVMLWPDLNSRFEQGDNNLAARFSLIGTAMNMTKDSPLVGQGLNMYFLKMQAFIPPTESSTFEYLVHNKFLLTLAETGILGLLSFCFFYGLAVRDTLFICRHSFLMGAPFLGAWIVLLIDMNLESYEAGAGIQTFWMMAGAAMATRASLSSVEAGGSALRTRLSPELFRGLSPRVNAHHA
jgi:putative inorganic carbon (HCO3(-)) transporter